MGGWVSNLTEGARAALKNSKIKPEKESWYIQLMNFSV